MFTRTRSKKRRSGGAPFCRLCAAEVQVDLLGQCRLGHQTIDEGFSATSGPEVVDEDAALVGAAVAEPLSTEAEAPFDADSDRAERTVVSDAVGDVPDDDPDPYGTTTHWVDDSAELLEEAAEPVTEGLWSAPTFGFPTPADEVAHAATEVPTTSSWQDDLAGDESAVAPGDEPDTDEPTEATALATADGGVAADTARQRLLEAASWFAAGQDDTTH